MDNYIERARATLLNPVEMGDRELDTLLGKMTGRDIDHADLYFQFTRQESWVLEEGIVKSGSYNVDKGVGLRAVSGDKSGFAFSDDLRFPTLAQAAESARGISQGLGSGRIAAAARRSVNAPILYEPHDPLASISDADKVSLLERVEQEARKADPRVSQVIANLAGSHEIVMVVRADGEVCADVRPLVRLTVNVVAQSNGRREQGSFSGGSRGTYDSLTNDDVALGYAREAVRQALVNLESINAPAGTMDVVLGPGWPGIILHEAVGHGLEGDFNRKGTSAYAGRVGEKVASELCTIVDDGTIANRRGSLTIDDEGTPSMNSVLIENGILKGYMQDLTNARLMGQPATGNGRRQSFRHQPMPRMTNTYMLPGDSTHDEIIGSVDKGLYAVSFSGGQVDITSGEFVFSATEAYLIEKGKVSHPVKGVTLIGNGPDVLNRITMVGNNLELDSGTGTCGKNGQSVPVGVGQPTIRINSLTVGGVEI
ncbi:MAG: metalloprotease TldD [Acidiferrobacterales bacterium]|nr:metalloprotease TldD [Acidiferrobacterales bacterium]